jgi:hypothetical protein
MNGIDDAKFWRETTRMPDLQRLIERAGRRLATRLVEQYDPNRHTGYPEITPDEWRKWDAANAEFQEHRRAAISSLAAAASITIETKTPACDPKARELKQLQAELRAVSGTPLRSDDDRLHRQALWQRLDQLLKEQQPRDPQEQPNK